MVFDTCGPVIGVAAASENRVAARTERIRRGAEGRLVPWVSEVCAELGARRSDIIGVGAAHGPGAFTGLRVGLATASGLALALNVPLWTTDSLGHRRGTAGAGRVLVMLDARKSRVYATSYVGEHRVDKAADVAPEVAIGWMSSPFESTGEGALVYREQVEQAGGVVIERASDPAVGVLARATWDAIRGGHGGAAEHVAPLYLRAPDAKPPRRGRLTRETKRR